MNSKIIYKNYPIIFIDPDSTRCRWFEQEFSSFYTIFTAATPESASEIYKLNDIALLLSGKGEGNTPDNRFIHPALLEEPFSDSLKIILTNETDAPETLPLLESGKVYRFISARSGTDSLRIDIKLAIQCYSLLHDRDQLYQEKVYTIKKIARANRLTAVGLLSAGMVHEINNPLVAVSTFLQMIPEKLNEEEIDRQFWFDYYEIVLKELKRIQDLTTKLVKYATYGTNEPLALQKHNINTIIEEMRSFISSQAAKKRIRIHLDLAKNLPQILVDRDKIKQVLLNLLLNAIQSFDNEEKGSILVTTKELATKKGKLVEISVQDTGAGMSEASLEKLFTPFYTTKESEGSGLGLMTCHHIIDSHRGNIHVESKAEIGSTFIITLPVNPGRHDRRRAGDR